MAGQNVVESPTPGNGISMEALRQTCLTQSIEIGEIGHALSAISELLDAIGERTDKEAYRSLSGSSYVLASLGKRLAVLADDVDDMPFTLKAAGVDHE